EAVWQVLPAFVARCLWRSWRVVEEAVAQPDATKGRESPVVLRCTPSDTAGCSYAGTEPAQGVFRSAFWVSAGRGARAFWNSWLPTPRLSGGKARRSVRAGAVLAAEGGAGSRMDNVF